MQGHGHMRGAGDTMAGLRSSRSLWMFSIIRTACRNVQGTVLPSSTASSSVSPTHA